MLNTDHTNLFYAPSSAYSKPIQITQSSRLILRTWHEADATKAFEFYGDPEVSKFIGNGRPAKSVEHVQSILQKLIDHHAQSGFCPWAVEDAASGKLIGICGIHTFNPACEPELGFRIARAWWGRGIATKASKLALVHGRDKLSLNKISALTHQENVATQKLLVNVGFRLIGATEAEGRAWLRFEIQST